VLLNIIYQHCNASVFLKNGKIILLELTGKFRFQKTEKWKKNPAKTAVSPRSSPLRLFREE